MDPFDSLPDERTSSRDHGGVTTGHSEPKPPPSQTAQTTALPPPDDGPYDSGYAAYGGGVGGIPVPVPAPEPAGGHTGNQDEPSKIKAPRVRRRHRKLKVAAITVTLSRADESVLSKLTEFDDDYVKLELQYERERIALEVAYERRWDELRNARLQRLLKAPSEAEALLGSHYPLSQPTGSLEWRTGTPGLPGFWLAVLERVPGIDRLIEPYDRPVLDFLADIESQWIDETGDQGFRLQFSFSPNPYFAHSELSVMYSTRRVNDFVDHLECVSIEATEVKWHPAAAEIRLRKSRPPRETGNSSTGKPREVKVWPSLFDDLFLTVKEGASIPEVAGLGNRESTNPKERLQNLLKDRYEQGITIRDQLIPHAVRWLTGEFPSSNTFNGGKSPFLGMTH